MAADYEEMIEQLNRFYDFTGKTVLVVGAGGGQLVGARVTARKLVAIDIDAAALAELGRVVTAKGLSDRYELVHADFFAFDRPVDAVYFEFCLHEMSDPSRALRHARDLAPDTVVFDHLPDSPWAFHTVEEEKARRSTEAMDVHGVRRRETFRRGQKFRNFDELLAKVASQGALAIERVQAFRHVADVSIPFGYGLTLL